MSVTLIKRLSVPKVGLLSDNVDNVELSLSKVPVSESAVVLVPLTVTPDTGVTFNNPKLSWITTVIVSLLEGDRLMMESPLIGIV